MDTKESKFDKIVSTISNIIIVVLIIIILSNIIASYKIRKHSYGLSEKEIEGDSEAIAEVSRNLKKVKAIINENYLGEIDQAGLIEGAVKGYVEGLGDKYTTYYTKEEWEEISEELSGEFYGIGVYMKRDVKDDGNIIISEVFENSPAQKAGLKSEDKILKVDGKEVSAKDFEEIPKMIKGKEKTKVAITVLRGENDIMDFEVERGKVEITSVKSKMLEDNIGYIYISTFDENANDKFKKEYDNLKKQGMNKLIIDLRLNGGGELKATEDIIEMFLEKDKIMYTTNNNKGERKDHKTQKAGFDDIPIIIITNNYSASASEVLTAALKDNGRAKVVGDVTYGKGVIQTVIAPIVRGGALKITIEEYLRPNGEQINGVGITPDVEVEINKDTKEDEQLNKAIEEIKNI